MKPARVLALMLVVAIAAALAAVLLRGRMASPQSSAPAPAADEMQIFSVRGQIISLNADSGMVKIAHEEIPNYMPAMTMPFLVRDSSLRGLKPGDPVTFKLSVDSKDSWITDLEKRSGVTSTPPPETPAADPDYLKAGEKVPEFNFVDQNGKTRNSSEFAGKYVIYTFIYTRCPLPNFCPLLSKKFAELQDRLGKEFPGKFQLVSVSIDHAHDTPEVLKGYAKLHHADESIWTFATGSPEQVSTIALLFGLTYSQKTPGFIDHDMRTALVGVDGRLIHIWKSNFWTPYEIRNRIFDDPAKISRK